MSGITDQPFRRLAMKFGAGMVVSEMVAAPEVMRKTAKTRYRLKRDAKEGLATVQLVGIEPNIMAEAAQYCVAGGADIIDINFGCPTKKVTKRSSGSAIMRDEALAAKIMTAVVEAVDVPVTVKMRLGWDDDSRNAPHLAHIAEDTGIQMITVHGRTRCQMFNGSADWRFLSSVKASVTIPVIANGDIATIEDAKTCLEMSQCDGVMVGRASRGKPWLTGTIVRGLAGVDMTPPTRAERHRACRQHFDGLLNHYGRHSGLLAWRKHMAWYADAEVELGAQSSAGRGQLLAVANVADEPAVVMEAIDRFFSPVSENLAA